MIPRLNRAKRVSKRSWVGNHYEIRSFSGRPYAAFSFPGLSSCHGTRRLGLRYTNPPDSSSHFQNNDSEGQGPEGERQLLSDAEWELRTGRTIDILTTTLPSFFATGLMISWDPETGEAYPSRSLPSLSPLPHMSPDPKGTKNKKGKEREPIFSPHIRLTYTPPAPLPHPLPEKLTLEGKRLYLASAAFVRHTLNTLYFDLKVTLIKVAASVPKSRSSNSIPDDGRARVPSPGSEGKEESDPGHIQHPEGKQTNGRDKRTTNSGYKREKSFYIALRVTGTSRVTGAQGQWEVKSTYTFSPLTAEIILHTVNGIEPPPQKSVYDALHRALGLGSTGPMQALTPCGTDSERSRRS
jgi:hypothetical protein